MRLLGILIAKKQLRGINRLYLNILFKDFLCTNNSQYCIGINNFLIGLIFPRKGFNLVRRDILILNIYLSGKTLKRFSMM